MNTILVPVDFSANSKKAIEAAVFLAKRKNMNLKLLHVIELPYTPGFSASGEVILEDNMHQLYTLKLMEKTKKMLHAIANEIEQQGIKVEYNVSVDRIYTAVINTDAELIIISSRGHNDVEGFYLGSDAEKIIRISGVPVLTVKDMPGEFHINRMVFASGFEDPDINVIIQRVRDFATLFNAELLFITVDTTGNFSVAEKERNIKKFHLPAESYHIYQASNEEEGIIAFAEEQDVNLISICTQGRVGLAGLFAHRIAENVAGRSHIPVLTYNINPKLINKSTVHVTVK
jgi:nucleotide-binding universal stress UspA family protein